MSINACTRDIAYLQKVGRLTALVPINNKNGSFNYIFLCFSIFVVISQSIWEYDSLDLSKIKKTSAKIHASIFYIALWFSAVFGRISFLFAAPLCYTLFRDLEDYVRYYISPDKKVKRGYKVTCLVILNFIYIIQAIEYTAREFFTHPFQKNLQNDQGRPNHGNSNFGDQGQEKDENCQRYLISCDYKIMITIFSVIFKFMSSASLYYLTYFVIVISDLFAQILTSFEEDILVRLGYVTFDPDRFFIIKNGGQIEKKEKGAMTEKKDLQNQFSRLKDLFSKFNTVVGPSLCVSFLADILVMICIAFSLIPTNLTKWGQAGGQAYGQASLVKPQSFDPIVQTFTTGPLDEGTSAPLDYNSFEGNETEKSNAAGGGIGTSFMIAHLRGEDHGYFLSDAIHYVFGILHECRAILLAAIGSYLKGKVENLKDHLERKQVEEEGDKWKASEVEGFMINREERRGAVALCKRVGRWHWELKSLDMITVDLALIPTILSTIMTYVVVLLQIRLSES